MSELNRKIDLALKNVADFKSELKHCNGQIDEMKNKEMKSYADASASAMKDIQEIKAKQEAADKLAVELETKYSRIGSPREQKTMGSYIDQMSRYLRSGSSIDAEVVEDISQSLVSKSFYGMSEEKKQYEVKTLVAGSNPQGGYWIMPERLSQVITRDFETSPIRRFANVITSSTDSVEMIIDDQLGTTSGWTGELQTISPTDTPEIGKLTISVHEQKALNEISQKMLNNAGFNIEQWLLGKIAEKITLDENSAFVVGDGSKKPKGLLSLPAWSTPGVYERFKVEQVNSGVDGDIDRLSLLKLQTSVQEAYQPNAVFMMNRSSWLNVLQLSNTTNDFLIGPTLLKDGTSLGILGKPVVFADDMPAFSSDSLSIIYGDLSAYMIVDKVGVRVLRNEFTKANQGIVQYFYFKEVGGDVIHFDKYKILKLAV